MAGDKRVFTIGCGDDLIRVRRDGKGCLLFDSKGVLLEGNHTVWEIMTILSDGYTIEDATKELSERYGLPFASLQADIKDFFAMMARYGWKRCE